MSALTTAPFLLTALPLVGALIGSALWNRPESLRVCVLLTTMASLGAIGLFAGSQPTAAPPLLVLLPLMAFLSLLGQPAHPRHRSAWLVTLLFLALGLGTLAFTAPVSGLCFLGFLAVFGLSLFHYRRPTAWDAWPEFTAITLGIAAAAVGVLGAPPVSSVAWITASAAALPLIPFHRPYIAALTSLPGNLPAFLALALPVLGFQALLTTLPHVPPMLFDILGILALAGSLYASLRALARSHGFSGVAYGGVALFSILWWNVAFTQTAVSASLLFVCAVGSATGGLLLASCVLRVRYGEIGLRGLSGLAQSMPRFAVLFSLLALAALGLPPFGVFAGFFGMLLAPSFTWSGGMVLILVAWLAASWYGFDLMQGILFGPRQTERRHHEDLRDPEFASLALVLALLLALGLLPSKVFDPAQPDRTVVLKRPAWNQ